ncbi:MAG: cell division protein FtsK [Planctomycetia bacterium]|nr:cell division protein FtsK [Planctomycetia bacterium]
MAEAPAEPAPDTPYDRDVLRAQMATLRSEAAARAKLENEIAAEHEAERTAAQADSDQKLAATREKYAREIDATRREYETVLQKVAAQAAAEQKKLDEQRKGFAATILRTCAAQEKQLKDDDQFEDSTFRDTWKDKRKEPNQRHARAEKELTRTLAQLDEADHKSLQALAGWRITPPPEPGDQASLDSSAPLESSPPAGDVLAQLERLRAEIVEAAAALCGLATARTAFSGGTLGAAIVLPIVAALAAAAATFFLVPGDMQLRSIVAGTVALLVAGLGAGLSVVLVGRLRKRARAEAVDLRARLGGEITRARRLHAAGLQFIKARRDDQARELEERFNREVAERAAVLQAKLAEAVARKDKQSAELEAKYHAKVAEIARKRDSSKQAAEAKYPPRLAALETGCREDLARLESAKVERLAAADARRDQRWREMTDRWREARTSTAAVYEEVSRIDAEAFRGWEALADEATPLPVACPQGLRFGTQSLTLEKVPGGVSPHAELNAFGPVSWTQPALVPFPRHASLLIKTTADQKETASAMMQALMLRIASGIPAGQSRFTIIDPLGLGKQFAGFMHLADHDELLVTSRIWTEPQQIEQRLADITEQMEVVIQKYLRNEYESIGDYNADAEVPEPYRFVAVANFPANFTETSARRLASIAASGARCGVYLVLSVDTKAALPSDFSLADVEKHSTTLVLKDGTFTWTDPEFSRWPLTVEQAPSDEVFTQIIQRVGKAAKAAKRVEVPFDRVAPKEEDWWKGSTASEVLAPLGPAGAKKLQYLKLGKGTSQHVLIAGKTGSGKSTLMHAMITSLALQYSPNEIQFYLIDFKKGVEFKLYDHYKLPHARVIAIESEREFGLSVLEQLDRELKRRGDLFRDLAVQDVAGFRATGHADPMPRILLIIDEFQEIFVEDDKLAQEAALILDRLVRQGRAFGMHVLLGSQTLGGSYSLPRATMGQMAVRVALQCNEADSSLILSEDNTAARLLTRPGEAIYNDANGMVAGNNPFQVVFLNDERRERYLGALRAMADRRTDIPAVPRMVFDGNEAADPAGNPLLRELLATNTVHGRELTAPLAWLGDAIAIKDPTAAIFRRQGGANMLVVGQREDLGTALLAMSIVSLAAGHDPHPGGGTGRPARFVLFEPAIAEEKPEIMLASLAGNLPHDVEVVGRLGVPDAMERVAAEVRRRVDGQVLDGEAVFVVIRDLARFRELRKADDGFGFSFGSEKKVGPAQHFLDILKDGPTVGIHVLLWCDSLTNLMRTFERGALKEFELRVLFQMSGSDSSQLIDNPLASKLGPQRALFIHEETGTFEKFRPYAFPSPAWLAGLSARLRERPQGTPGERPAAAASPQPPPSAAAEQGETFDFGFGGAEGEFNFTKFLDDPPNPGADPIPPAP